MIYPGNSSLSAAVKDRVVSTFQQTLGLYKQGRRDEVAAGCGLILQMDPMFEPARKLLEKSRNPSLPLDVDALLPVDSRPPIEQAREAMAARDFQRVIHLTTEILTDDLMNDEARVLGDEARDKLEAAPFVEQFARKVDQQLTAGNVAGAQHDLEKARQLDPTHPEVVRMAKAVAAKATAAPAPAPPVFDASSFIVDTPQSPASGRSTAQASDFGFTFEEEKPAGRETGAFAGFSFGDAAPAAPAAPAAQAAPAEPGGFSFDAPSADAPFANFSFDAAPAAPAPAASGGFSFDPPSTAPSGGFDFATASISTTPDDQKKIDQYLADGDRAFDAGDYQQAIELWSRIFLIDVTNDAASDRIERAKARRREIDQRVETTLANAVDAFERKDFNRARAEFGEVLRLDPHHATAQEFMERLNAGGAAGAAAGAAAVPPPPPDEKLDLFMDDEAMDGGYEAPLMPPDPAEEADEAAQAAKPISKKSGAMKAPARPAARKPTGAILAVLGLLVLGAGGWFVWTRFMNKPEASPAQTQQIFDRASALARSGKYDQAIAVLQDIQPTDPEHDKALEMIADLQQKKTGAAAMIDGKPAAQFYDEKVAAAMAAVTAHDYVAAKKAFEDAMRVKPLPPDARAAYDSAAQQVAKLDAAKALFAERKFAEAIANLQPLLEQDPQNVSIRKMLSDAHFNLGATALQEERIPDAVREFDEVLKADPNDELARRSRELAQRYDEQPKDLLYRIYVKYLPLRSTQ